MSTPSPPVDQATVALYNHTLSERPEIHRKHTNRSVGVMRNQRTRHRRKSLGTINVASNFNTCPQQ